MTGRVARVELCPPEARAGALEVLYRRIPVPLRDRLVAEVLHEAAIGQVDLSGLWVAWDHPWRLGWMRPAPRIVGTLLTQALAGRMAAVWAPEVRSALRRGTIAGMLVRSALANFQARGFRLAQAVLDESATPRGALDLIQGGMPRITELLYLERDTQVPLAPAAAGADGPAAQRPALHWRPFDPDDQAEFRRLLNATYTASLDLPELDGVRSLDDILAGHRAAGRFVPERWQLGMVAGEPSSAVVLMLQEIPERDVWEVVYLGLTPAARGRGLGRAAIAHALELARRHAPRLELAVDVRNHPATRLYESTGFACFDRRAVHLAVFPQDR